MYSTEYINTNNKSLNQNIAKNLFELQKYSIEYLKVEN
uniref:Uncharacterized protein n=1 Tax=viral metagenome TaxID=1070528 RepID=A0A6C0BCU2_9ZZZZ